MSEKKSKGQAPKRKTRRQTIQGRGLEIVRGARLLHAELERLLTALGERSTAKTTDFRHVPLPVLTAALWPHGAPIYKTIDHYMSQRGAREEIACRLVIIATQLAADGADLDAGIAAAIAVRADGETLPKHLIRAAQERDYSTDYGKAFAIFKIIAADVPCKPAIGAREAEALRAGSPLHRLFVYARENLRT